MLRVTDLKFISTPFRHLISFFYTEVPQGKRIQVNDTLPSIEVFEHNLQNKINIRNIFAGKKGILFSLPGAFVPGCTQGHFPHYLSKYENYVLDGFSVMACVCVNDPIILDAWSKEVNPDGKVRMLADTSGEFTKAINMVLNSQSILGSTRSKRYSMLINDNVITHINNDPDVSGLSCLLCLERDKDIMPANALN